MLVSVKSVNNKTSVSPPQPPMVHLQAPFGTAVVLWGGDPQQADGRHLVEWSVDEDILWGCNARAAALDEPGLWQDGERIVLRGRLDVTEDGAAVLEFGSTHILFDLAGPLPDDNLDGTWVEISTKQDRVSVWPFQI
ncbi:hypothetical protein [Streptomyces sp. NPDC053079]|uniref:hypothetical protein n=1 Tax=Streptomyces sp. NPDC053079 TaxID=3365697 RepID=UPI0037D738E8